MDWHYCFNALKFQHDLLLDQNVYAVAAVEFNALVLLEAPAESESLCSLGSTHGRRIARRLIRVAQVPVRDALPARIR